MKKASLCRVLTLAVLGLTASVSLPASAAQITEFAQFSKTYAFPVSSYQKIETAMQTAAARTGADKSTDVSYDIDTTENATVHCGAQEPIVVSGYLYGCTLNFAVDLGGGAMLTARKMLYLQQSTKDVYNALSKVDPNNTPRANLNTPFDGGNGSTYYCNAEGAAGAKQWACYLSVID